MKQRYSRGERPLGDRRPAVRQSGAPFNGGVRKYPGVRHREVRKRIPADYHWQLLSLLTDELRYEVTEGLYRELKQAIRLRDVDRYDALDRSWGLQCMSTWVSRPHAGYPACVRLLVSVIRKHPSMETVKAKDRKIQCLDAVKRLDSEIPTSSPYWASDEVFLQLKDILREILGPVPTAEVIAENARHGPGSTTTISYKDRNRYFKYRNWPYPVSPRAADLLTAVIKLDERWVGVLEDSFREKYRIPKWRVLNQDVFWKNVVHPEFVWNKVTTVPKDGAKDRPIAIEPDGNVFLQLGIDGVIRSRLRADGLNLDSQQRNRQWCLKFSKEDSGYTIDLSNASDTISRAFCASVLPSDWFELLDCVRSPYGEFPDGTGWLYAKMSSMGNATTFVLESLLFWGLLKAVSRVFGHPTDRFTVFGDDLLGERYLANHTFIYLRLCGFIPNPQKSFLTGPVRESCGVDAFEGEDIRPVFLKTVPVTDRDLLNDRNRLNRWFAVHLGTSLPLQIDAFFMKYLMEMPLGPESDEEFDTYWHVSCFPFKEHDAFSSQVTDRPAKDFGFRKLMHNLRGGSEGGRFRVSEEKVGVVRLIRRSPHMGGYSHHGEILDYPKQPYQQNAEMVP